MTQIFDLCLYSKVKNKLKEIFSIDAEVHMLNRILTELRENGNPDFLVATYLNRELEKLLGQGCVLTESFGIVLKKARGINDFLRQPGPARWALDQINKGRFSNFEEAFKVIHKECKNPGGGLMLITVRETGEDFIFDPSQSELPGEGGDTKGGTCWRISDGKEYFLILFKGKVFFVSQQGKSLDKVIAQIGQSV